MDFGLPGKVKFSFCSLSFKPCSIVGATVTVHQFFCICAPVGTIKTTGFVRSHFNLHS